MYRKKKNVQNISRKKNQTEFFEPIRRRNRRCIRFDVPVNFDFDSYAIDKQKKLVGQKQFKSKNQTTTSINCRSNCNKNSNNNIEIRCKNCRLLRRY